MSYLMVTVFTFQVGVIYPHFTGQQYSIKETSYTF